MPNLDLPVTQGFLNKIFRLSLEHAELLCVQVSVFYQKGENLFFVGRQLTIREFVTEDKLGDWSF